MAHMQKFSRGAVGHMLGHYDRSKEVPELKAPVNTVLNYNLAYNDQRLNQLDFIHRRLSEIRVQNRKDVNVMIDWVVTIPQSLNNQGLADEDRFFREAYNFLTARYGKENVISAYVHMDEVTPHMHFAFVPVTEDKKRGGFKLSAKEVVNRQDLRTFHKDLSDYMEHVFGRDIGILNEATKEGNKSIEELKRGTAQEKLKIATLEASRIVSKAREVVKVVEQDIQVLEDQKTALEGEIKALGDKLEGRQLQIREVMEIKPEYEKGLFGSVKGIKGVTVSDVENLKATAIKGLEARDKLEKLTFEYERVKKLVPTMDKRMKDVREKIRLEQLEKAFQRLPEHIQKQLLSAKNKSHDRGQEQER